jgi:hypothetical protein
MQIPLHLSTYIDMKIIFLITVQVFMGILVKAQSDTTISMIEMQVNGQERIWHSEDVNKITNPLKLYEDSLVYMADSMYESQEASVREEANYYFIKLLKNTWKLQGASTYAFDKLSQKINILTSQDNSFRIYNWQIIRANNERRYYGAIVRPNGNIAPLIDVSGKIIAGEDDSLFTNGRWYGGSYYKMMEKKTAAGTNYFLLGYNGNNPSYNIKFMDVLHFNEKQEPKFGAPFFMSPNKKGHPVCNRYILYYQKDTRVSFNLDTELDMIIHDHLESSNGDPAKRTTLAPDGTYDGLKWNGTGWLLVPNAVKVDPLTDGQAPNTLPVNPIR